MKPMTATKKEISSYLPPILQQVWELRHMALAQQERMDHLLDTAQEVLDNQYIDDAKEPGIQRYEEIFGITPKDGDTLEQRRLQLPFTMATLRRQLTAVCGPEGATAQAKDYILRVLLSLGSKHAAEDVREMLKRIVPANMVISIGLDYNTHQRLHGYTHSELHRYTQQGLKDEVILHA